MQVRCDAGTMPAQLVKVLQMLWVHSHGEATPGALQVWMQSSTSTKTSTLLLQVHSDNSTGRPTYATPEYQYILDDVKTETSCYPTEGELTPVQLDSGPSSMQLIKRSRHSLALAS